MWPCFMYKIKYELLFHLRKLLVKMNIFLQTLRKGWFLMSINIIIIWSKMLDQKTLFCGEELEVKDVLQNILIAYCLRYRRGIRFIPL